ncbi:hypothetical protein [Cellulosilyticum ruminicola]|uniref:hypothetical protein n=1 Tax=Cellulosilyticum ruminicola TaxID=425254 RepID=UPI0009FB07A8|nr:hypothetical protein [Cellulosilyticum ruminicola]
MKKYNIQSTVIEPEPIETNFFIENLSAHANYKLIENKASYIVDISSFVGNNIDLETFIIK